MSAVICTVCLIGACIALAFGVVRLFPAYRRCADLAATRPIRDAAVVAQARAELAQRNGRDLTDVARTERLRCSLHASVASSEDAAWLI
jgi:hypothetical protein